MEWFWTILIGAAVGWLASAFLKTSVLLGPLPNAAAGAVGSVIGAYTMATMMARVQGPPGSWLIAFISAAMAVAFLRWVSAPVPAEVRRRR